VIVLMQIKATILPDSYQYFGKFRPWDMPNRPKEQKTCRFFKLFPFRPRAELTRIPAACGRRIWHRSSVLFARFLEGRCQLETPPDGEFRLRTA
jgi:hypothetical protein